MQIDVVGIVVTRNGLTRGCLASTLGTMVDAGIVPLVVDDASEDGTIVEARRFTRFTRAAVPLPDGAGWGARERAIRLAALHWAAEFRPRWCCFLDDDEWFCSPMTVGQMIREQCGLDLVDVYLMRTLHYWDDYQHVKTWARDPEDARPHAWRWRDGVPLDLPDLRVHCGQAPTYTRNGRIVPLRNVCVGHAGYLRREQREQKAAYYRAAETPEQRTAFSPDELLTDAGVIEWDGRFLVGLP